MVSEEQDDEGLIQTPDELLQQLKAGEFEVDPFTINYEIQRLIYGEDIKCSNFDDLFVALLSIMNDDQIVEFTEVVFPGFCNWIEIMVKEGTINSFSIPDFHTFHDEVLSRMGESTCNPCSTDFDEIWSIFYDEAQKRFERRELDLQDQIKLASLFKSHDELADLLLTFDDYSIQEETGEAENYLDLIDPDKIIDPILKGSIMEMKRDAEWSFS